MNPIDASYYNNYEGGEAPVAQFVPPRHMAKVSITQLAMIPSGTYNQQFQRPWVANHNPANAGEINDIIQRSYRQHQMEVQAGRVSSDSAFQITPELVASSSSNFIQPVARHEGPVGLVGGWEEQRASFVMHINAEIQGVGIQEYILTGFTDGNGLSATGNIAPEMTMFINAVYETRIIEEATPFGMQKRKILSNASQVLANYNYNGNVDNGVQLRMRPQDVIGQININHVPELASGAVEIIDLRSHQTSTPVKSNFQHANPNNYLATIIGGLVSGEVQARAQNRHQHMYDLAAATVADQAVNRDPFMRMMSSIRGGAATNSFQFRDLIELDSNVVRPEITKVVWRGRPEAVGANNAPGEDFHRAGQTQFWHAQDRPTVVATMIANTVPSMMANLMIGSISMHATNRGPGGIPFMMHSSVDSIVPMGIDMTAMAEAFKEQFRIHLLNDISHNNSITYEIAVTANLMGEIWISLNLEGFHPVDYVMPTYANSLLTPVITRNRQNVSNLATQFSELKSEALPSNATGINSAPQFFLPSGNTY